MRYSKPIPVNTRPKLRYVVVFQTAGIVDSPHCNADISLFSGGHKQDDDVIN